MNEIYKFTFTKIIDGNLSWIKVLIGTWTNFDPYEVCLFIKLANSVLFCSTISKNKSARIIVKSPPPHFIGFGFSEDDASPPMNIEGITFEDHPH